MILGRRDVILRMLGKRVNGSIRPWIRPRIFWISYIVYIRIDENLCVWGKRVHSRPCVDSV